MMQTEKRVGTDRFKFMLEYPNRMRIYVTDEQMLSKILEKSGISSEAKTSPIGSSQQQSVEKGEPIQSHLEFQRQDYGKINPAANNEIKKSECNDLNSRKKIDDLREVDIGNLSGCKINEDENGFTIVRKSKRGYEYTTKIRRSIVDDVFDYLKNNGGQVPVSEIEKALRLHNVVVNSALKVLQVHGKVRLESDQRPGRNHWYLYRAV
jgi:hypothetical protein